MEELTFGGKTEEEVAQLKKAKHELEKRAKDQEEELDDLAGQVQLLEQAKLRLEMSIEQQRKEMRKEMQQRDEELEDVRGNALKKVKALESQLENEHEERTILLREKHELERRLVAIEEQDRADRAVDAETTQRFTIFCLKIIFVYIQIAFYLNHFHSNATCVLYLICFLF